MFGSPLRAAWAKVYKVQMFDLSIIFNFRRYLIKGFQEQQEVINTQKTKIDAQQVEIDNLKAQMTLLINSASLDAFKQNVVQ